MNIQENILRIKTLMESNLKFVDKEKLDIKRESSFVNNYGERMDLIETQDENVYLKHEDYHNKFIWLDDLISVGPYDAFFKLTLSKDELRFLTKFLIDSKKYEFLIYHLIRQFKKKR